MALDSPRFSEWARMLGATVLVTLLYLLVQNLELQLMAAAGRLGWLTRDVAESLAGEARQVAERSAPLEASLDPRHRALAWMLGLRLGYASEELGSFAYSSPEVQAQARQALAGMLGHASQLGEALGIGPVAVMPSPTAQAFADLRGRIERDELGIGARLERQTTPRARHLFLLGMHVGVALAELSSSGDLAPAPAAKEIASHATLAGVPEALWRPLTQPPAGDRAGAVAAYRAAVAAVDAWLAQP